MSTGPNGTAVDLNTQSDSELGHLAGPLDFCGRAGDEKGAGDTTRDHSEGDNGVLPGGSGGGQAGQAWCQGRRQNIPLWRRESVPPG